MARRDQRTPHRAIEQFEGRWTRTSVSQAARPGPEFDPPYRGRGPKNCQRDVAGVHEAHNRIRVDRDAR